MLSKRCLTQLKSVKAAIILSSNKKKVEANLVLNLAQLKINDNKLSITNTSDIKDEFGIWFWNKSANKNDSDTKEKGDKEEEKGENNKSNSKIKKPSTEKAVSPEIKIKQNKKREDKLCGVCKNRLISTLRKIQKAALELEKQASKTYNIRKL